MAERFNTRNVKNKEIYDSYMGILRISPNEIMGTDVDDPTQLLNTLYNEDEKRRTVIILSDSDGNILPVTFQPRAFNTTVVERDTTTATDSFKNIDLLNVATIIGIDDGDDSKFTKSKLYVSNEMKCRSTLLLSRTEGEQEAKYRHSNLKILSGGEPSISSKLKTGRGWLLYPTDSPNDDNYFNAKNKHKLFDEKDKNTPRYKQVENSLYSWSRKEHEKAGISNERVIVGNKLITQINEYNEEVPLYYTRDYILGHYDGHQMITGIQNNTTFNSWGIDGTDGSIGKTNYMTKLSWTRFDKLIWDSLEEIITGNVRHIKGRYDELGINEVAAPGIVDKLGLDRSSVEHEYKKFAPILGTEMARGTIVYHAMPFHRYWYHRTRQALRGCIERRKLEMGERVLDKPETTKMDDYIVENDLAANNYAMSDSGAETFHRHEVNTLEAFYKNKLLTPCSMGTVGFAHSLGKNFALCNGRSLRFQNFPNISVTNEIIFNTGEIIGSIPTLDSSNGFSHRTQTDLTGSVISALANSNTLSGSTYAQLPNLFALFEKSPRFIRGLMWRATTDDDVSVNVFNENDGKSNYIPSTDLANPSNGLEIINKDTNGKSVSLRVANKNFSNVNKLNFHTFDHLIEKETHHHKMWSYIEGDEGGMNLVEISKAHCQNTRGGNVINSHKWHSATLMNFDRTYSQTALFTGLSSGIQFEYMFNAGSTGAWNDSGRWASYCAGSGNNVYTGQLYESFTPIPTLGLILFNTSICNNKSQAGDIRGLHPNATRYQDAEGKWHNFEEEAPISVSKQQIEKEGKPTSLIKEYDAQKQRRKFFAMKMNEAEGFIPISWFGKASGYVHLAWSRDERSGSNSSSRNTYHDYKYNVGGYKMAIPKGDYIESAEDGSPVSYWRCMTSIAYINPNKLGVGDIANYINNKRDYNENTDYYDVNCVTQLPKNDTYKNYKYGGVNIKVDETCPTPPYINLLPLIRI